MPPQREESPIERMKQLQDELLNAMESLIKAQEKVSESMEKVKKLNDQLKALDPRTITTTDFASYANEITKAIEAENSQTERLRDEEKKAGDRAKTISKQMRALDKIEKEIQAGNSVTLEGLPLSPQFLEILIETIKQKNIAQPTQKISVLKIKNCEIPPQQVEKMRELLELVGKNGEVHFENIQISQHNRQDFEALFNQLELKKVVVAGNSGILSSLHSAKIKEVNIVELKRNNSFEDAHNVAEFVKATKGIGVVEIEVNDRLAYEWHTRTVLLKDISATIKNNIITDFIFNEAPGFSLANYDSVNTTAQKAQKAKVRNTLIGSLNVIFSGDSTFVDSVTKTLDRLDKIYGYQSLSLHIKSMNYFFNSSLYKDRNNPNMNAAIDQLENELQLFNRLRTDPQKAAESAVIAKQILEHLWIVTQHPKFDAKHAKAIAPHVKTLRKCFDHVGSNAVFLENKTDGNISLKDYLGKIIQPNSSDASSNKNYLRMIFGNQSWWDWFRGKRHSMERIHERNRQPLPIPDNANVAPKTPAEVKRIVKNFLEQVKRKSGSPVNSQDIGEIVDLLKSGQLTEKQLDQLGKKAKDVIVNYIFDMPAHSTDAKKKKQELLQMLYSENNSLHKMASVNRGFGLFAASTPGKAKAKYDEFVTAEKKSKNALTESINVAEALCKEMTSKSANTNDGKLEWQQFIYLIVGLKHRCEHVRVIQVDERDKERINDLFKNVKQMISDIHDDTEKKAVENLMAHLINSGFHSVEEMNIARSLITPAETPTIRHVL